MRHIGSLSVICSLAVLVSACADTPTTVAAGAARMDNGGSYGSGGRAPGYAEQSAPDSTLVSGSVTTVFCNGGSYGSGGRSEECVEDGS